ncbi:PCYCGC motif-containing (lipo)protein [Paenibacillus beijingensis]|uniref:Lipoprotein n=1 Tax=Paenibacillus beijingensis TaxID=1126833 RepID=A0A0D5NKM2_9BACL|nr:PCYCGC motif-containing (lipo)protein [Paenibacillus beijingensis]AJY75483.1 lipoprotein [Paenibacillus beijingensis]
MKTKAILAVIAAALFLTACGSKKQEGITHAHNGDLQVITASASILPSFLEGQSEDIRLVYEAAGKAKELLQWIPCYCGCGESAGHKSNLNCFIHKVNEDGSVVWDDHGTRCGVCLQIAAASIKMKAEGKSEKEIRAHIDDAYKEGYAAPTNTPMPA